MSAKKNLLIGVLAFLVLVVALLFMGGFWPGGQGVNRLRAAAIGGPFTLEAGDGSTVTDRTYRDKWQLIYFGYTLCPDACPTALNDIAGALQQLGPLAAKVQPIFITVDPERDTPKVVGSYVKAFGDRIIGLTGTPDQIAAAARAFRVYYAKAPDKDAPNGYLMDHSSVIYVMRPGDFGFVATFNGDASADQMAQRLRQLVAAS
jgi:protein SCO1/2